MKEKRKRLDLAAAVLRVVLLVIKFADALIDLLSKVVNYRFAYVR